MAEYDILYAFGYNIQKAKDLADAVDMMGRGKGVGEGLYQFTEDIAKSTLPNIVVESAAPITDRLEYGFNECMDRLQGSVLEASIVMTVTAFETYMRDKYAEKKQLNDGDKSLLRSFMALKYVKERYEELGFRDLIDETTEQELKKILQMRHIIVHRSGIIDKKACEAAGWDKDVIGNNIKKFLDYNTATNAISVIDRFVRDLDEKITGHISLL